MPDASSIITLPDGATLEIFDDKRVQRTADGTVLEMYNDGKKVQTHVSGLKIEVFPDGRRIQTNADGSSIEVFGTDGDIERIERGGDGVVSTFYRDGSRLQQSNEVEILVRPDGSRKQTNADGTVIEISSTGTVQTNPDGTKIVINQPVEVEKPKTAPPSPPPPPPAPAPAEQEEPPPVPPSDEIFDPKNFPVPDKKKRDSSSGTHRRALSQKALFAKAQADAAAKETTTESTSPHSSRRASSHSATETAKLTKKRSGRRTSSHVSTPGEPTSVKQGGDTSKATESDSTIKVEKLERKIRSLRKQNNQLTVTLNELETRSIADLEKARKKAEQETEALMEQLKEANEKAGKTATLENALLENTKAMESTSARNEMKLEELDKALKDKTNECTELNAELATLKSSFDTRLKEETESLRRQIQDLENANRQSVARLKQGGSEQSAQIRELGQKLANAENALRESQSSLNGYKGKLATSEAAVESWKAKLASSGKEVKDLKAKMVDVDKENEALRDQVEDLIFKGGSCAEQLIDLRREKDNAVEAEEKAVTKLAELTEKMVETLSSLTARENELAEVYNELSRARENDGNASSPTSALKYERERVKVLEGQLKEALAIKESNLAKTPTPTSSSSSNEQVLALKRNLEHSQVLCKSLKNDLEKSNVERDSLSVKLSTLEKENEILQTRQKEESNKSTRVKQTVAKEEELKKEVSKLQVALASAERELKESSERVKQLESALIQTPMTMMDSVTEQPKPNSPPQMGAILSDIKQVKKSPFAGGLLAEIKGGGGGALKKTEPIAKKKPPPSPAAPSIAELCQLKAKQRADKSQKIDDILSKNKKSPSSSETSELQKALARRTSKAT